MTFFMWAVLLLLAYIAFMVTNHANAGDKQAEFLVNKINGLSYEIQDIKQGCKRAVRDSADEQHERMCDVFDEVQDAVNKIKEVGEANHRWIMANHCLIATTYRLTAATNDRTHCLDLQLAHTIRGYSENWTSDESYYECNNIIKQNGFYEADYFIKKVNEE